MLFVIIPAAILVSVTCLAYFVLNFVFALPHELQTNKQVPHRKRENKMSNQNNPIATVITLLLVGGGAWYYFGGGIEHQAERTMQRIEQQVATDSVGQYEIAKQSGNPIDAYVHAGLVAAAYLQANDEANYQKWKRIEASEAARAGIPTR